MNFNKKSLCFFCNLLVITGGLVLLTTSCALRRLKENVQQISANGSVAIEVFNLSPTVTNYAFAMHPAVNGTSEILGAQTIGSDGFAVFLLRQNQTYAAGAFSDINGNVQFDLGEPAAWLSDIRPTPLTETGEGARPIPMTLSTNNKFPGGQTFALPKQKASSEETISVAMGTLADLDQPQFSAAVGEISMWQPYEFIHRYECGIYFLEKYDPNKLPVLFIYGIAGSAQDWRPVFEKLDRKKYQPWVFQYASGFRLDKSANALSSFLLALKQRHGFERMAIVAHSMGGLVARGAIQRTASLAEKNFISNFVTISTPWGGHQTAELGVKHLEFPVPSWRDMATGSDYLKDIVARPLPKGTRHDLIFSYKSSGGFGLPDENDGVVAVQSELVPHVQEAAASVLGLYESHSGILSAPETMRRIERALSR